MADLINRTSKNAPGSYYVDDTCIDCDMCRSVAPGIFRRDDDGSQSFVFRQPQTGEELELAEEARNGCPTDSIGEDGADQ